MNVLNIYHKDRRKPCTLLVRLSCVSDGDCRRMRLLIREFIMEHRNDKQNFKRKDMRFEIV